VNKTLLALVLGVCAGGIVGVIDARKAGRRTRALVAAPTKIPTEWIDEKGIRAGDKFADLTPAQRYVLLKVLNEKPCTCGCEHGSIAQCRKLDPDCQQSDAQLDFGVKLVKEGRSAEEVYSMLEVGKAEEVNPTNPPPPLTGAKQKVPPPKIE